MDRLRISPEFPSEDILVSGYCSTFSKSTSRKATMAMNGFPWKFLHRFFLWIRTKFVFGNHPRILSEMLSVILQENHRFFQKFLLVFLQKIFHRFLHKFLQRFLQTCYKGFLQTLPCRFLPKFLHKCVQGFQVQRNLLRSKINQCTPSEITPDIWSWNLSRFDPEICSVIFSYFFPGILKN